MRVLGFCAFTAGGAMLLQGFFADPSRHPAHEAGLGLLDQQAALATAGGTLCVVGAVLLVGAALAGRLDELRRAVCPTAAPTPVPGPSPANRSDDDGDDYAGYPTYAWADAGRRTWRARGGE